MTEEVTKEELYKFFDDAGLHVTMDTHAFIRAYKKDGKVTVQLDGYITFTKAESK